MARPTKLTPELQRKLCDAIAAGNYYQAACVYAGLGYRTFREWMKRGAKASRGQFRQFRQAVLKAQADAEVRIVAQWQSHMPDNWQACRDFLARRFAGRWAERTEIKHKGKVGVEMEMVEVLKEAEKNHPPAD